MEAMRWEPANRRANASSLVACLSSLASYRLNEGKVVKEAV